MKAADNKRMKNNGISPKWEYHILTISIIFTIEVKRRIVPCFRHFPVRHTLFCQGQKYVQKRLGGSANHR
jgi:hypothetical protein